jgi:hypothetical protein
MLPRDSHLGDKIRDPLDLDERRGEQRFEILVVHKETLDLICEFILGVFQCTPSVALPQVKAGAILVVIHIIGEDPPPRQPVL